MGKLSAKQSLEKSSEMTNRIYQMEKSEPWQKQHIRAPAMT